MDICNHANFIYFIFVKREHWNNHKPDSILKLVQRVNLPVYQVSVGCYCTGRSWGFCWQILRTSLQNDACYSVASPCWFYLFRCIQLIRVNENSSKRWYHLARKASSLFPIEGSRSITRPVGILLNSRQSLRKEMCDSYRSALSRKQFSLMIFKFPSCRFVCPLLRTVMLLI